MKYILLTVLWLCSFKISMHRFNDINSTKIWFAKIQCIRPWPNGFGKKWMAIFQDENLSKVRCTIAETLTAIRCKESVALTMG